ncbi:hypothetical protein B0H19DRAFT_667327 [Mycena capillaripes]|nr:hypothetical protein B0H19DRAFT_667327 [Mycena capillaripes]
MSGFKDESLPAADLHWAADGAPRPVISTVAPEELRKVLNTRAWVATDDWKDMSSLARETVQSQLDAYAAYIGARSHSLPSFVDLTASMLPSKLSAEELSDIPQHLWTKIPYPAFRRLLHSSEKENPEPEPSTTDEDPEPPAKRQKGFKIDVDEHILTYEKRLGETKDSDKDWKLGLVRLEDADAVFPGSTLTDDARTITRPTTLNGYQILGELRQPHICIQPSVPAFERRFEKMTGGLLAKLDWSNVFVAGGIVLGALHAVDSPSSSVPDAEWVSSDIDIYIYGLAPAAATEKIKHIFDIFRGNLPADAPALVVRNSKTITFYSDYPTRRIQIVLKLVKSPKDVLLNFDLDICSIGWDGSEVWMLPRAARALETGYNVFTMNLIQGHYLSERRATQEQRVFKYAYRGYGIRFLESYLDALDDAYDKWDSIARGEDCGSLDMQYNAVVARKWTKAVIKKTHGPFRPGWPTLCSPLDLENGRQVSSEPQAQSCLSGFTLFMRHVALWEMERRDEVEIEKKEWAVAYYGETSTLSYDDTPKYQWGEEFQLQEFRVQMDQFNAKQISSWFPWRGRAADIDFGDSYSNTWGDEWVPPPQLQNLRRLAYASDAASVLTAEQDIAMPVTLPTNFAAFANGLVNAAAADAGLGVLTPPILSPVDASPDVQRALTDPDDATLRLFIWRMPASLMWQQLDRRIDEVVEALYAFYHALDNRSETQREVNLRIITNLSRRAIRAQVDDEFAAFARWVGRQPIYTHQFNKGWD